MFGALSASGNELALRTAQLLKEDFATSFLLAWKAGPAPPGTVAHWRAMFRAKYAVRRAQRLRFCERFRHVPGTRFREKRKFLRQHQRAGVVEAVGVKERNLRNYCCRDEDRNQDNARHDFV